MDTLRDRLVELADDAPTGGAPAAELWARGKRAGRLRVTALASMVLVVFVVGARLGVGLPDGKPTVLLAPGSAGGIALPIEYPVGEELPGLGDAPGPLAAIWVSPGAGDGAPEVVGLVAETGMFGTLPYELSLPGSVASFATGVALSPDGRRVAYRSTTGQVVVHNVVSGESSTPLAGKIDTRDGFTWYGEVGLIARGYKYRPVPLVGHVAGGTDVDGWVWQPGRAPKLADLRDWITGGSTFLEPYGTRDISVKIQGGGPRSCSPPTLDNRSEHWDVPGLCDVLHVVYAGDPAGVGDLLLLGHWNDPDDRNGTVVAVPVMWGFPEHEEDPDERRVVVTAGAPERVTFATALIGEALDLEVGAP